MARLKVPNSMLGFQRAVCYMDALSVSLEYT